MKFETMAFKSYVESVPPLLESIGAAAVFARQTRILLKPNLVNASPYPVTTPAALCEALLQYIGSCSGAEIVIAEGCGDAQLETYDVFHKLGYTRLAEQYHVSLVDLNSEPVIRLADTDCVDMPECFLPEILWTGFLVSLPVLKAHSLSMITGSMKNMIGCAPSAYYSGRFGSWKKAFFHQKLHEGIRALNHYRTPDMTIMDAAVGLADYHLGGAECDPPVGQLLAGYDARAVDRHAAGLLGLDWRTVPHLT